jgi:hypothetical protein
VTPWRKIVEKLNRELSKPLRTAQISEGDNTMNISIDYDQIERKSASNTHKAVILIVTKPSFSI